MTALTRFASRFALALLCGVAVSPLTSCDSEPPGPVDDVPDDDSPPDRPDGPPDDGPPDEPGVTDPFEPLPDESEGLVNVSADLEELLEYGALETACDEYRADPDDRRKRLMCGKAMFFYEGFGTAGVPRPIVTWTIESFPDEVGAGFEKLGMVLDPYSDDNLPLGMAPGAPMGTVGTLAFACASCHFGRLPDGRYAVGAANYDYRYGAQNLMLTMVPALAIPGASPDDHHADALAVVQPLRDKMAAEPALTWSLLAALAPLITSGNTELPAFSAENEGYYASWRDGTMDFFIQPLPFDDEVHTISKISPLWEIPTPEARAERGMPSAFLGWTGGTYSLINFVRSFVKLGGGEQSEWPVEDMAPLVEYIQSLRAPVNLDPPAPDAVAAGALVFRAEGCIDCHGGPRGSGIELYDFEDIGTDSAMKRWADGDLDGVPDNGIVFEENDSVTHQIKSPRLVGLWAMTRFLHNGSVDTLEQLLCLEGERGSIVEPGFGDGGHFFGCDLTDSDRRALVAYLRSH